MSLFSPLLTNKALKNLQDAISKESGTAIIPSIVPHDKLLLLNLKEPELGQYKAIYKRLSLLPFHLLENAIPLFDFYYREWPLMVNKLQSSRSPLLRDVPLLFEGLLTMTLQGISCWPEPPWSIANKLKTLSSHLSKLEKFASPLVNLLIHDGQWHTGTNHLLLHDDVRMIVSERHRGKGEAEHLWKASHKYELTLSKLKKDSFFLVDWDNIKKTFPLKKFYDRYGIIRRTIMPERNWRKDYDPQYSTTKDQFQCAFDFFCWKWGLYGMKGDDPLVEKLSFAVTPYGTQIFIPSYWSFDYVRDILWKDLIKLHRSRGIGKQGEKLDFNRSEKNKQLKKLHRFVLMAQKRKLRGKSKYSFIKESMGFPLTMDDGHLRKLIVESSKI